MRGQLAGARGVSSSPARARPARTRSAAEAVKEAEVVVIATPWSAAEAAIKSLGNLAGKIVIDCMNPLGMGPDGLQLVLGFNTSAGEQVASWASGRLCLQDDGNVISRYKCLVGLMFLKYSERAQESAFDLIGCSRDVDVNAISPDFPARHREGVRAFLRSPLQPADEQSRAPVEARPAAVRARLPRRPVDPT